MFASVCKLNYATRRVKTVSLNGLQIPLKLSFKLLLLRYYKWYNVILIPEIFNNRTTFSCQIFEQFQHTSRQTQHKK